MRKRGSDPASFKLGGICLDCADAEVMARFYGEVFGWEVTGRDTPDTRLGGAAGVASTPAETSITTTVRPSRSR